MRIPAAEPNFGPEELEAVSRVLKSGLVAQGPEVALFEQEFSEALVSGLHCVAVNSGTSALHLSLVALGVGPGDEVIVPSFTFAATANAVAFTGATPVFVDIDPLTYSIDPDALVSSLTRRTVGIVPVHLYGHPADMQALIRVADRHGLWILEDAAQAHGARWTGLPVGTWGVAAAFSFYPTKNMTSGEGGMIVTQSEDLARRARLLRNQGQERRYHNEIVGLNNRMTDIHAAIGRVQLRRLHEWNERRRENAEFLSKHLSALVQVPVVHTDATHVFHQYTIRVPSDARDGLQQWLERQRIGAAVYYPTPVHQLPAFALKIDLPETTRAAREVLSLPVHPRLTGLQLERIVQVVNSYMGAH